MAWVAVGMGALSLISGSLQAGITLEQGETQKIITDMNAKFLDIDAYHASQEGQTNTARYQSQIDATVGEQRAAQAANGVDVNFGTAAQEQTETKVTGFLNQLDLMNQARAKTYGIENQAMNLRLTGINQQAQSVADASAKQSQALIQGASTALSAYQQSKLAKKSTTGY